MKFTNFIFDRLWVATLHKGSKVLHNLKFNQQFIAIFISLYFILCLDHEGNYCKYIL